jgi:hypothetical protein
MLRWKIFARHERGALLLLLLLRNHGEMTGEASKLIRDEVFNENGNFENSAANVQEFSFRTLVKAAA